ncbi:prevent-host-death family protein [Rhizobium sullae]|uniref:Antitoxin n=1 Tax=Rhizobium sullae TaxID=50338 RepID=A0A4R3PZR1_RHISU|nr:prevent-host-death family protein [Rhizobium sullae]
MDNVAINEVIPTMKQFTTGDLNKRVGDVTDAAVREPVVITRHRKPRYVLMSYEHYERIRADADPRRAVKASEMPDFSPARSIDWHAAKAMTMSREYRPGEIVTYPHLWVWQQDRGETEGRKEWPSAL